MTLPVVAVVGRPNVGKSTLVNRIIERRDAIVQERPGVTRDRVLYPAEWLGRTFLLVDSGGLESEPASELGRKIADAATAAAAEADVVLFVVDVTSGLTAEDRDVADLLRRVPGRVIVVANKADNAARAREAVELFELGFGEPFAVSATHGRGTGDLLDEVTRDFPPPADEDEADPEPGIAIVGRPNVGKSSLFNLLTGGQRSIVHDEPGTTRDAVDTVVEVDGLRYRFVDTAGLRRSARVDDQTEFYGTVRTMKAIERSELALIVIDAVEGIARQDLRICEQVAERGRSAIVVLNKWDALEERERSVVVAETRRRLPHLAYAPLLQTSAVSGAGTGEILPTIQRVLDGRDVRIPTPVLNATIEDMQARTPIPSQRHARIKYAVQAEVAPPLIVLFGTSRIPDTWLRYLEKGLRNRYGFEGTPIHFSLKGQAPQRGPAARRPRRAGKR